MRESLKTVLDHIKKPILIALVFLVICGLGYPLLMTGISQLIFPYQAGGSLVEVGGRVVGSELIGQDFTDNRFMRCRPSAVGYNTYTEEEKESGEYEGVASGSDNYAPSNPLLVQRVEDDIAAFLETHPTVAREDIPTDLLTASGSGLDPHISPAAAAVQIPTLMETTGLSEDQLESFVAQCTGKRLFKVFGEETVNVLQVNLLIAQELGLL